MVKFFSQDIAARLSWGLSAWHNRCRNNFYYFTFILLYIYLSGSNNENAFNQRTILSLCTNFHISMFCLNCVCNFFILATCWNKKIIVKCFSQEHDKERFERLMVVGKKPRCNSLHPIIKSTAALTDKKITEPSSWNLYRIVMAFSSKSILSITKAKDFKAVWVHHVFYRNFLNQEQYFVTICLLEYKTCRKKFINLTWGCD